MARPKKPKYEYVEKLKLYRKRIKDSDGKYVAIYASDPDELTVKIREAEALIQRSIYNCQNPTLSDYAAKWLAMHEPNVQPGTMRDYRYIVTHFIQEPLGHKRMNEITQDDVKLALLCAATKSESVHRKAVMLYKQIFESAVDNGDIPSNPCRKLGKGGKPPKQKHALTDDQASVLLDAVSTAKTDAHLFCMIGLYSGCRREEIMALRWDNVILDTEAPHIRVRQALRWESNRPVVSDQLKSPAARRDIPIPPQLVSCLREHRDRTSSPYVFSGSTGEPKTETQFQHMWNSVTTRMVKPHTYTKYLDNGEKVKKTITPQKGEKAKCRNYCYTIDFDVSPHILRHTYITNLLLAGVDVKTVQYLAGHEHAKITLDIYSHLMYNKPEDIISKVNSAFEVKTEVNSHQQS